MSDTFDIYSAMPQVTLQDTLTPAQLLAEQNRSRLGEAEKAADRAGGFVTGADQDEVDALLAGVRSGVYSVEDALGRLSNIEAAGRESLSTGGGTGNVDTLDENTFATLKSYLKDFGLESLEGTLTELMARGIDEEASVLFELRNTDVFKTRFKANEVRRAAGLPSLSPRAYLDQENTYREVLRRGGMLEYFNRQDIFESLIGGDVSPQELFDRMTNAYQVVREANPAVKAQMRTLYKVEDKDLAAFFLDPKSGVDVLKRKAQAAKIAATGLERSGIQLGPESAEDIASRGFTDTQASEAFGSIGQQAELYKPIQRGEEEIGEEQRIGAAFGYNTDAFNLVERRRAKRLGEFKGGGQFARTTGATSGTTETSIGTAQ
jgi:hypothetical protein